MPCAWCGVPDLLGADIGGDAVQLGREGFVCGPCAAFESTAVQRASSEMAPATGEF